MGLFDWLKGKKESVDQSAARREAPGRETGPGGLDESKFIPFYQAIADKLDEIVPGEWEEIAMYAEAFSGVATASFYYKEPGGETYLSGGKIPDRDGVDTNTYFRLMQELITDVKALQREFVQCGQPEWKALTFFLNSDFKFRAAYSYDLDEEVDSYQRQLCWAYQTLGLEPADGCGKTALREYLERERST